jgi:hypothetical protein
MMGHGENDLDRRGVRCGRGAGVNPLAALVRRYQRAERMASAFLNYVPGLIGNVIWFASIIIGGWALARFVIPHG